MEEWDDETLNLDPSEIEQLSQFGQLQRPDDVLSRREQGYRQITEDDRNATWGDYGKALVGGAVGIGSDLAGFSEYLTGAGGETRRDLSRLRDDWYGDMTPAGQRAMGSSFLPDEGEVGTFSGNTDTTQALGLKLTATIPSLITALIPAGLAGQLARGASLATRAAVAGSAAKLTSGAQVAGGTAAQIYEQIERMSDDDLYKAGGSFAGYIDMGYSPQEAREKYMKDVAAYAPLIAGAVSYALGGVEGQLGRMVGGAASGGIRRGAVSGLAREAMQEAGEGFAQEAGSQAALVEGNLLNDMNWRKIVNTVVEGATLGAVLGGTAGGIGGAFNRPEKTIKDEAKNGLDPAAETALRTGQQPATPPGNAGQPVAAPTPPAGPAPATPAPAQAAAPAPTQPAASPTPVQTAPGGLSRRSADIAIQHTAAGMATPLNDAQLREAIDLAVGQPFKVDGPELKQIITDVITKSRAPLQGQVNPVTGDALSGTVPEAIAQLQGQVELLRRGEVAGVLIPTGTKTPGLKADGMKIMGVPGGRVIYDPARVKGQEIWTAARNGTLGEFLGMPRPKTEAVAAEAAGQPVAAIQARDAAGIPVKEAVVPAAMVAQDAATMQEQLPSTTVEVTDPEAVLAEREALRAAEPTIDDTEAEVAALFRVPGDVSALEIGANATPAAKEAAAEANADLGAPVPPKVAKAKATSKAKEQTGRTLSGKELEVAKEEAMRLLREAQESKAVPAGVTMLLDTNAVATEAARIAAEKTEQAANISRATRTSAPRKAEEVETDDAAYKRFRRRVARVVESGEATEWYTKAAELIAEADKRQGKAKTPYKARIVSLMKSEPEAIEAVQKSGKAKAAKALDTEAKAPTDDEKAKAAVAEAAERKENIDKIVRAERDKLIDAKIDPRLLLPIPDKDQNLNTYLFDMRAKRKALVLMLDKLGPEFAKRSEEDREALLQVYVETRDKTTEKMVQSQEQATKSLDEEAQRIDEGGVVSDDATDTTYEVTGDEAVEEGDVGQDEAFVVFASSGADEDSETDAAVDPLSMVPRLEPNPPGAIPEDAIRGFEDRSGKVTIETKKRRTYTIPKKVLKRKFSDHLGGEHEVTAEVLLPEFLDGIKKFLNYDSLGSRLLASRILALAGKNLTETKVIILDASVEKAGFHGIYHVKADTIAFPREALFDPHATRTILHEVTHALTSDAVAGVQSGTLKDTGWYKELTSVWNAAKRQYKQEAAARRGQPVDDNWTENIDEFIADLWSYGDLQQWLASTPVGRRGGDIPSLWQRFLNTIARLFGIAGKNHVTALERALWLSEKAFDENTLGRTMYDPANLRGNGTLMNPLRTAFRRWFEGSKVVDENGEPVVVYHATNTGEDFEGFWHFQHFGTQQAAEDRWLATRMSVSDGERWIKKVEGKTFPVYLSIKNPMELPDGGINSPSSYMVDAQNAGYITVEQLERFRAIRSKEYDAFNQAMVAARSGTPWTSKEYRAKEDALKERVAERAADILNEAGYDGIKYVNKTEDKGSVSWVALRPQQVKGVFNRGTWDGRDPRMLYLKVREQAKQQLTRAGKGRGAIRRLVGFMTLDQVAQGAIRHEQTDDAKAMVQAIRDGVQKVTPFANELREKGEKLAEQWWDRQRREPGLWRGIAAKLVDVTSLDVNLVDGVGVTDADLTKANTHLGKKSFMGGQGRAKVRELQDWFSSLKPEDRKLILATSAYYKEQQDALADGSIRNILKAVTSLNETQIALIVSITKSRKKLPADVYEPIIGKPALKALNEIGGVRVGAGMYFPLLRHGNWVVTWREKIGNTFGGNQIAPNEVEFVAADEKAARKMAEAFRDDTDLTVIGWDIDRERDDGNVSITVRVQTQGTAMRESEADAAELVAELQADSRVEWVADYSLKDEVNYRNPEMSQMAVSTLVRNVEQTLAGEANAGKRALVAEAARQAAIQLMPGNRLSKRSLARRHVKGADTDFARALTQYAEAVSRARAKQRYMPDVYQAMSTYEKHVKSKPNGDWLGRMFLNEFRNRIDANVVNFTEPPAWMSTWLSLSFLDKLFTPAYSITNAMQVAMVAYPYLAGKFGQVDTGVAIGKAYHAVGFRSAVTGGIMNSARAVKEFTRTSLIDTTDVLASIRANTAKEADGAALGALLDYAVERGAIDPQAGFEMAQTVAQAKGKVGETVSRFDRIARQLPTAIEQVNRAVTLIAAYRLAARSMPADKAMEYAMDATRNTQGDYSAVNAAPIFNNNLGRFILQFKKYGQMMIWLMGDMLYRGFKGATREEKAVAWKQFATLLGTHASMAGLMGLPGLELVRLGFMAGAMMGFGGGYEEWERGIREDVTDWVGPSAADMLLKGAPRGLNIDLSTRLGLDSILTMGEPRQYKAAGVWEWAGSTLVGAPGMLMVDQMKAFGSITQGVTEMDSEAFLKGVEKLPMGRLVTDISKAARLGMFGTSSELTGKPTSEPAGVGQMVANVMGYSTANQDLQFTFQAAAYDERGEMIEEDREVSRLRNRFATARTEGERMRLVARELDALNASLPEEKRITIRDLRKFKRQYDKDVRTGKIVDNFRVGDEVEAQRLKELERIYMR